MGADAGPRDTDSDRQPSVTADDHPAFPSPEPSGFRERGARGTALKLRPPMGRSSSFHHPAGPACRSASGAAISSVQWRSLAQVGLRPCPRLWSSRLRSLLGWQRVAHALDADRNDESHPAVAAAAAKPPVTAAPIARRLRRQGDGRLALPMVAAGSFTVMAHGRGRDPWRKPVPTGGCRRRCAGRTRAWRRRRVDGSGSSDTTADDRIADGGRGNPEQHPPRSRPVPGPDPATRPRHRPFGPE